MIFYPTSLYLTKIVMSNNTLYEAYDEERLNKLTNKQKVLCSMIKLAQKYKTRTLNSIGRSSWYELNYEDRKRIVKYEDYILFKSIQEQIFELIYLNEERQYLSSPSRNVPNILYQGCTVEQNGVTKYVNNINFDTLHVRVFSRLINWHDLSPSERLNIYNSIKSQDCPQNYPKTMYTNLLIRLSLFDSL